LANAIVSGLGYGLIALFVIPFAFPILGAILVIPSDLVGSKLWHYVVADMMAFGSGLIAWIITFTLSAIAWVYLKLDAAFAKREIQWDWRRRRLTICGCRDEEVYSFQEIRQINIREVRQPGAGPMGAGQPVFRMEAQLTASSVVLLEGDESDEIAGLAETGLSADERIRILSDDLSRHLEVPTQLADPVIDRFNAVGYPRNANLKDVPILWNNATATTRTRIYILVAAVLLFWTFRLVQSYRANAVLLDSAPAAEPQ
jgi:hypothetical protein